MTWPMMIERIVALHLLCDTLVFGDHHDTLGLNHVCFHLFWCLISTCRSLSDHIQFAPTEVLSLPSIF